MSSKAKEYLLNAIYNLEKNYGKMPGKDANLVIFELALRQLKSSYRELTDNYNEELGALGLKKIESGEV